MNYIKKVRDKKPLIHHITNYVSMKLCADATYAIGALPIMADEESEVAEITGKSNALVINTGTPNKKRVASYRNAIQSAKAHNIPVIFDPVGANISAFRNNLCLEILKQSPTVVRLNRGELLALEQIKKVDSGIDYLGDDDVISTAENFSKKYQVITVCTGKDNIITDGENTKIVSNFNPLLRDITSSGCMTTSLIAAIISVNENHVEAIHTLLSQLKDVSNANKEVTPLKFISQYIDDIYRIER